MGHVRGEAFGVDPTPLLVSHPCSCLLSVPALEERVPLFLRSTATVSAPSCWKGLSTSPAPTRTCPSSLLSLPPCQSKSFPFGVCDPIFLVFFDLVTPPLCYLSMGYWQAKYFSLCVLVLGRGCRSPTTHLLRSPLH